MRSSCRTSWMGSCSSCGRATATATPSSPPTPTCGPAWCRASSSTTSVRSSPAVSADPAAADRGLAGPAMSEAPLSGGRWTTLVLVEPVLLALAAVVAVTVLGGPNAHDDLRLLVARGGIAVLVLQLALYYGDVYGVEA